LPLVDPELNGMELGVGVRIPGGARFFSVPRRPDWFWAPLGLLSCGYRGFIRQLNDSREADDSPTSADMKNTWIYTSTPPIRLHGVVLNLISTGTTLPAYSHEPYLK
jgi:hypothetical protein